MMTRERANLGFDTGTETDADTGSPFNPADWAIGAPTPPRPETGSARKAAEATGFRSREVTTPAVSASGPTLVPNTPTAHDMSVGQGRGQGAKPRRRRTGRNAQFNLKARPDTIQSFCDVADAQGWGLGETLEHAVRLLEAEYKVKQALK